jgi:hypothetical protein
MIPNIGGETLAQGVYSTDSNYHSLLNWYVANRRNQLFNGLWDMQKLPDAQPAPFYNQVTFGSADYNPGIPGQAYIQICNNNDYGMDVSGWRIAGGVDWTFPNGTVILPHAVVFVVEDPQAFRQREGSPGGDQGLFIQGPYSGNLSSNGERLFLLAPDGSQIASQDVGADHAVINELQANSPSGGAGDWIELLNPTTWTVDLSGLWLSDSATTLGKWQIPAGTVLAPGQLVTFTQNQDFGSAFGLDKNGESVVLSDGGTIIDEQDFKASPLGATLGRYQTSDGKWDFPRLASPTFNAPNSTPLVGPVVINEIMYHPLDGNDEFVELFNITNQPVSLFDAASPTHTWTVSGGTTYTFPTGQTIPAGGLAILTSAVVTDPTVMTAFRAKYSIPSAVQVYGPYLGHLNNSGDKVTLNQPGPYDSGTGTYPLYQVDHVQYEPVWPWPSAADGTGKDLERINPFVYGNDPANWSALDNGSPGQGGLIAGDANADGKVSFADYLILEANFGKSGMNWGTADFNGDGLVGFADYLILEANFGKKLVASAPAPAPLSEQTTIQTMAAAAVVQTSSSVTTSSNTIVLTQPSTVRLPASVHSINRSLSRLSLEDALNLLAI